MVEEEAGPGVQVLQLQVRPALSKVSESDISFFVTS